MNYKLIWIFILLIKICINDNFWRGIAFEGGGTKGIYNYGSMKALLDKLNPIDISYDFCSGVSVGSLNALGWMSILKGN